MQIVAGDFRYPGGAGSLYIPPATVHRGWGLESSAHVVGDGRRPLPDSVEVLFFSWLEDRFYRGRFALPRDSIARLFREGFPSRDLRGERETYDVLVAGVAPGGAVAVWASGSERQVEVFFGQARPAPDVDFHRAFDAPDDLDRRAFVEADLADAAKRDPLVAVMRRHVPTAARWAAYRARYRWTPAFEGGLGAPEWLTRVQYLNGERENLEVRAAGAAARPAPRAFGFTDPRARVLYSPQFDDEEVASAFARVGAGGRPVELVFAAPAPGAADPRVLVRGGGETVELRKVTYLR